MGHGHDDALLACDLAEAAGRVLLGVRGAGLTGRDLAEAGDRAAHEYLVAELARIRPADVVLSEEGADPQERLKAERVWIVDPLDGTREFSEVGRPDWAVHVALWERGELTAGAIALPAEGLSYNTARPPVLPTRGVPIVGSALNGAALNSTALNSTGPDGAVRVAVSRTRPPHLVHGLVARLGARPVPMGSAGVKCASVWRGEADAYVHAGGQYEWDSAAPVAVARAAGLFTSRIDGSPLVYNRPDPLLPDLLVCRPELAETLLHTLSELLRLDDATEPEVNAR
jgi:3'(2'), 5'-bisphosphate nucleotidase